MDACVGFGMAVHFAKVGPTPGLPGPQLQATSAVSPVGGLGTDISGVGGRAKIYTLKPVKPIHASRAWTSGWSPLLCLSTNLC